MAEAAAGKLGYLIAGFLVGPHFTLFPTVAEAANIQVWAEISLPLFIWSSNSVLKNEGRSISIGNRYSAGMLLIGWCYRSLGYWPSMDSISWVVCWSISSTTIIIRAFEELGVKGHKFCRTGIWNIDS